MEHPSYYSILTANVRYDPRLKNYADCKVLYSEITALSNKYGYCHATNKYFAKLYDRPVPTISKWVSLLRDCGYLKVVMIKDGNQIKERRIYPISNPINVDVNTYSREREGGIKPSVKAPINVDVKENTTSINNTRTNKDDDDVRTRETDQPNEDPVDIAKKAKINVDIGPHKMIFNDFIHTLGSPVVCWAVRRTSDKAHHPNWDYLLTVLKDLEANSVRTVEQAERLSEEYKQKTRRSYRGRNVPQVRETMPDWGKQDEATRTKRASASALAKARARQAKNREAKEGVKS